MMLSIIPSLPSSSPEAAALFLSLLTYLWSGALLEELPIVQPLKNSPAFYGTRRFNTVFTIALHWSLSTRLQV
jgi:hypothetical protein